MALDIQIASVSINHNNFRIVKYLDMSADLSFTVVDASGLNHYTNRMPVTVTDTVKGLIFAGYIDQPDEQNLYPRPNNKISIKCMDYREKALKRRPTYDYVGMLAGDIAVDMHANYLAAEGVLANYAYRRDTKQTQFAAGTLSGTSATNNVGDGDLELSLAGSPLTAVTNTTAGWGAGTLNSVVAANNQLVLKSRKGIALSGDNNGNQGSNAYLYWQIWAGSYVIASSDALTYKVWVNKNCPEIRAAMDFTCTDGSTLRDFVVSGHHVRDQNGIDTHPKTDLKGFADDQWYYRYFDLTPMAGKTIASVTLAFEGDAGGHYVAYFFDCQIVNGASTPLTIYANNGVLNTSKRAFDLGYSNISVTTPLVYDTPGTRISNATSLTSVGIANTGIVAISETIPANTSVEIDTSFDGGATWQPATDRTALAGLIAGASLSGIALTTRQILAITGDDPTVTPAVSSLAANFTPSYSATKHDSFNQANTTAEWTALGAVISGITIADQLALSNWRRNWDDGLLTSQTLYGSASPGQGPSYKRLFVSTNSGADVRSRQDYAGTYNNFTLLMDVQIPVFATDTVGVVYRTTAWGNGNASGAWAVDISQTSIQLGYGTNNGAGTAQTYTNVVTFSPPGFALTASSVHTLMLIVNGSNHQVWLDGVKYIDITNATYSGNTGYVALHAYNSSGSNASYFFDNFGIGAAISGSYETNNISLNTLATVGDSFIAWQQEPLPAGCSILVQSTIDGGSTFQTCTNGAEIPGLIPGTNTVGKNLRILITLTAPDVAYTPLLDGLVIWVTSNFSSSGTRVSPALSLSGVGRAGSTSLTWNDTLPTGCTLGMDVSPDGTTWTDVTANNGQPLPSALIFAQPDPYLDFFSSDSSANYTSVDYT